MKKKIALLMACVMAFGVAVGGTLAWLTDKTTPVVNTFTDSDINITLTETDTDQNTDGEQHDYQMIPGHTITKDPKVTVEAGSEACWLFVKVSESAAPALDTYISYEIADQYDATKNPNGWQTVDGKLTDNEYVIGRKILTADMGKAFDVIGYTNAKGEFVANQVLVKTSVTKPLMDAIDGKDDAGEPNDEKQPTLTFTAYATQLMKNNTEEFTAAQAWANIQTELNPPANP